MALSSQSIKNLKGGVSQQPDILRFPNQGAVQINGWSSETQGLQKRPPSKWIRRLHDAGTYGDKPLIHLINRDSSEQYYLIFSGSQLAVLDLNGVLYKVNGWNAYGQTANPRESLRVITVADYTFVVNREKTVGMTSKVTHAGYPALNTRAIVTCRGGQYGRTLTVRVNGSQIASYLLPDGLAENNTELKKEVEAMDAQNILGELARQINANTANTGITAKIGPTHMLLTGIVFNSIQTEDGYADQLITGFIHQVQSTTKLPIEAPNGYLVEITGEASRSGDNYWVRYDLAAKTWKETVKPGIIAGLDRNTMPHALVREANNEFTWKPLDWTERTCGDDETNPMVSLLDGTINDVFFFRNRLGFLSGENVVMSRTGRYFQLFPSSVAATADDDPIDVAVSHSKVSILKYAVPFSEQLLLWSDQAQFTLSSNGPLSAKTAQLDLTTEFDVMDTARPFGLGRGVYFSAPRARFSSVKRYYAVADVSAVKNAEDISAHIPSYIPNKVFNIHGSGTENYITCLSDGDPGKLFIYKFLYIEEELQQQSWSYWHFGKSTKVLACASIGSYMHLIIERPEGITVERIEFTQHTTDFDTEPYRAFMDGKRPTTISLYNEDAHESYINLPAILGGQVDPNTDYWIVGIDGWATKQKPWPSNGYLTIQGDWRGQVVYIGRAYEFVYEFSKFLIKIQADDGSVSTEDSGRFQLRKAWVNYHETGAFDIEVFNGNSTFKYVAGTPDVGQIQIGALTLASGQHRFTVNGNAVRQRVTIKSDYPQPLNIVGCGFEGNYVRRSNGI